MKDKRDALLTTELRRHAKNKGLDLLGVTSSKPFAFGDKGEECNPLKLLAEAKSVAVGACYTHGFESPVASEPGNPRGKYGPWTRASLGASQYGAKTISQFLISRGYSIMPAKNLPLKALAVRAGIVSYGKNCIVHADGFGSYIKLFAVVTNAPLEFVQKLVETSDCEDCQACLSACPTGALDTPYKLAVDRCICAWLWGDPIEREDREKIGSYIFRCGYCQEVCPKNANLSPREDYPFAIDEKSDSPELIPLILADEDYYKQVIPAFPLEAGSKIMRRNVIYAAGNSGDSAAIPNLTKALDWPEPEIRAAAVWALGKIGGEDARQALAEKQKSETEAAIQEEITEAPK